MTSRAITRTMAGLSVALLLLATGCVPDESAPSGSGDRTTSSEKVKKNHKTKRPPAPMPQLRGKSKAKAEAALVAAGFVVGKVVELPSARGAGTVLSQGVRAGATTKTGTAVPLTVAVPYPAVPAVTGRTQRAATIFLRRAGFAVSVQEETRTSGRDGAVLSQTPTGGQLARPGAAVTIVVSHVVAPLVPQVSQNCTPGYTPCLAPASDYDCSGGSGDGPRYTGLVHVTGSDVYDLDRDGDGLGCD